VPEECLRRSNKATASMDASNGLREHRADLLTLWEDSRLAELGLVDGAELRRLARRPAMVLQDGRTATGGRHEELLVGSALYREPAASRMLPVGGEPGSGKRGRTHG
jgi:hypothetical protein